MPQLNVCCRRILFNAENNVEKHSYFKLLAVKAAIIEDVEILPHSLSPVAQQCIVQLDEITMVGSEVAGPVQCPCLAQLGYKEDKVEDVKALSQYLCFT